MYDLLLNWVGPSAKAVLNPSLFAGKTNSRKKMTVDVPNVRQEKLSAIGPMIKRSAGMRVLVYMKRLKVSRGSLTQPNSTIERYWMIKIPAEPCIPEPLNL